MAARPPNWHVILKRKPSDLRGPGDLDKDNSANPHQLLFLVQFLLAKHIIGRAAAITDTSQPYQRVGKLEEFKFSQAGFEPCTSLEKHLDLLL